MSLGVTTPVLVRARLAFPNFLETYSFLTEHARTRHTSLKKEVRRTEVETENGFMEISRNSQVLLKFSKVIRKFLGTYIFLANFSEIHFTYGHLGGNLRKAKNAFPTMPCGGATDAHETIRSCPSVLARHRPQHHLVRMWYVLCVWE